MLAFFTYAFGNGHIEMRALQIEERKTHIQNILLILFKNEITFLFAITIANRSET